MNQDDVGSMKQMYDEAGQARRDLLPGNRKIFTPRIKKLMIKTRNPSLMKALGGNPISEDELGELAQLIKLGGQR